MSSYSKMNLRKQFSILIKKSTASIKIPGRKSNLDNYMEDFLMLRDKLANYKKQTMLYKRL